MTGGSAGGSTQRPVISVIGAGYVGLVTAACLAQLGSVIRCVDIDQSRISELRAGTMPIHEPELEELVLQQAAAARLSFHVDLEATYGSDLAIVAVGTLDRRGDWTGEFVRDAVVALAKDAAAPRQLVIRSTVLPGTTARLAAEVALIDPDVVVAVNPEFTREGNAVSDFFRPDRIVIGAPPGGSARSVATALCSIYQVLDAPIIVTDSTSAEMIKVSSNVFLAMKVSFANELARLASALGADIATVVDGVGLDKRIGRKFLSPGPGFGGSCLPSQARALAAMARVAEIRAPLIQGVDESNRAQTQWLTRTLEARLGSLPGRSIAVLGLAFKAGTDDVRESPALPLVEDLTRSNAVVAVHDPVALDAGVAHFARSGIRIRAANSVEEACQAADAVIVVTEWPHFRTIDWHAVAANMVGDLVVDARQVVDGTAVTKAGLRLVSHGRDAAA